MGNVDWSNIFAALMFFIFWLILTLRLFGLVEATDDQLLLNLGMAIYFKADSVRNHAQVRGAL